MTIIKPRDVAGFASRRPPGIAVVLLFGRDLGRVREVAKTLGGHVVQDLNDPFNAIELTDRELGQEPSRLNDEAVALSFMGGERLIRVREGGDAVARAVRGLLSGIENGSVQPNALTVIEAGDLSKGNALRKACEASPLAAAIGCYPDEARDISALVTEALKKESIDIDPDALRALAHHLGDDRGITQQAITSLVLYAGPKSIRSEHVTLTLDDVRAAVADSASDATFEAIDAVLDGQAPLLSRALFRAEAANVSPIALVKILQGKLHRLLTVQIAMEGGKSQGDAMKSVRPPVYYMEQKRFADQLTRWTKRRLEAALRLLLETDLAAKTTGMPQRQMVERLFIRLAAQ